MWTWKHNDLGDHPNFGGDFDAALRAIQARTMIVQAESDSYFPPVDSAYEAKTIADAELCVIPTIWGHIAPCSTRRLRPALSTRLTYDRVGMAGTRIVAPERDFTYRPMTVAEPFGYGEALRLPLRRFADDFGAELIEQAVVRVEAREHRVVLSGGMGLAYRWLVVAV